MVTACKTIAGYHKKDTQYSYLITDIYLSIHFSIDEYLVAFHLGLLYIVFTNLLLNAKDVSWNRIAESIGQVYVGFSRQ